jgi:hypothetical protein
MDTNLIKVGEKTYPVKYGFNALRLFCNASGIGLQELEKIGENISIDHAIKFGMGGNERRCTSREASLRS